MECPICMNNIISDQICLTSCSHSFCYDCLSRWFLIKNTCPSCREEVQSFKYKDEINRIFIINNNRDIENLNIDEIRGILNNVENTDIRIKKLIIKLRIVGFISMLFISSSLYLGIYCKYH